MASALALMGPGHRGFDLGNGINGVPGLLAESGVEFGASFAMGHVYHRYRHTKVGKNIFPIAAGVGKLGAAVVSCMLGGHANMASGLLNAVGSAGVSALGLEMGLVHARNLDGKQAVILPKSAALPKDGDRVAIGALPPAGPGRSLTWDQIEELAAMH